MHSLLSESHSQPLYFAEPASPISPENSWGLDSASNFHIAKWRCSPPSKVPQLLSLVLRRCSSGQTLLALPRSDALPFPRCPTPSLPLALSESSAATRPVRRQTDGLVPEGHCSR